jgi:hypothetical protein
VLLAAEGVTDRMNFASGLETFPSSSDRRSS